MMLPDYGLKLENNKQNMLRKLD